MSSKIVDIVLHGLRPLAFAWGGATVQVNEQDFRLMDSVSKSIGLKVVIYNGQLIITLFNVFLPEREVSLYNLMCYLGLVKKGESWPRFFEEESDFFVRCRNQITFEVNRILENLPTIRAFFREAGIHSRLDNLEKYIIHRYPEAFRRVSEE